MDVSSHATPNAISVNRRTPASKFALLGAVSFGVLAGHIAWAEPVAAQTPAIAVLDEIIVSARKRDESMQNAPISVSAFTAEALRQTGLDDLSGLGEITPNMVFDSYSSNASVTIRGVGQGDYLVTTDPAVGIYLDGVYLARNFGSILDLLDLERVEVLRGPQGTLFGKNTIGGAVNVVSAKPTGEFGGVLRAQTGSRNRLDIDGTVDFPISDQLHAKLAVSSRNQDGYTDRPFADESLSDTNSQSARLSLRWMPQENIDVILRADYTRGREKGDGMQSLNSVISVEPGPRYGGYPDLWNRVVAIPNGLDQYGLTGVWDSPPRVEYGTDLARNDFDVWGLNLTFEWDLGGVKVKSITGYRDVEVVFDQDNDHSPLDVHLTEPSFNFQDQFSEELQISGVALEDRLNWIAGLYYLKENASDRQIVNVWPGIIQALEAAPFQSVQAGGRRLTCPGGPSTRCIGGLNNPFNLDWEGHFDTNRDTKNTTYAAFAQVDWEFVDNLTATAGIRYNKDEKDYHFVQYRPTLAAMGSYFNVCSALPMETRDVPNCKDFDTTEGDKWGSWTPRFGLQYQVTPDHMIYTSYSRAIKSGGFHGRPVNVALVESYGPETVTAYEGGFKTQWFDDRLRLNGAVFWQDYQDIQFSFVTFEAGPPALTTENAGDARMYGGELELVALPIPALQVTASVGYLDFKMTRVEPGVGVTLDTIMPDVPKWNVALGGQYTASLGNSGALVLRGDMSYTTSSFNDTANSAILATKSHTLVNAKLTYVSPSEDWELFVAGRNLSNSTYLVQGNVSNLFGRTEGHYNAPREWLAGARFTF